MFTGLVFPHGGPARWPAHASLVLATSTCALMHPLVRARGPAWPPATRSPDGPAHKQRATSAAGATGEAAG